MKNLLTERQKLTEEINQMFATLNDTPESRRIMLQNSRRIWTRIHKIDATLNTQRKLLGAIIKHALVEAEFLSKAGRVQQVTDLIAIFRDLPVQMFDYTEGVSWDRLKSEITKYYQSYGQANCFQGVSYLSLLDRIETGE